MTWEPGVLHVHFTDRTPRARHGARRSVARLAVLVLLGAGGAAFAQDWTPQDVVEQRHRTEIATRAANLYLHPPALAVRLDPLELLLVEIDLPGGPTEPLMALARRWVPGRAAGSFGRGWAAPWEDVSGDTDLAGADAKVSRDPTGRLRHLAHGPDEVRLEYRDDGRLRAVRGRGGIEVETDASGRVVEARSTDGRRVRYAYGPTGCLERADVSTGAFAIYAYDDAGRLVAVEHEDAMRATILYGTDNALASVRGPGRAVSTFERKQNREGRFVTVTNAVGSSRTWEFRSRSREVIVNGPGASVEEKAYDDAGRLVCHREPDGSETTVVYDAQGRPARIERPGHVPETYAYDDAGRLVKVDSARETVQATYDVAGRIATFVDRSGTTRYEYGTDGCLARLTLPDGRKLVLGSDAEGRLTSIAREGAGDAASGTLARIAYDPVGRVRSIDGPNGRWELTRDNQGRLAQVTDPFEGTSRFEHGPTSVATIGPDGRKTTRDWDAGGRVVSERVEPGGLATTFERDPLGQVVAITHGGSRRTFAHDERGRLVQATGHGGVRTSFEWSATGSLTAFRRAGAGAIQLEYGPEGRVAGARAEGRGSLAFEHDSRGRLAVLREAGRHPRRYGYDGEGRVVEIELGGAVHRRTFDALGRVAELHRPMGGRTTVEYDPAGLPSRFTNAAGNVVELSHDEVGRLTGHRTTERRTTVTYDALGRPTELTSDGRVVRTLRYDVQGRLTAVETPARRVVYEYDATGAATARKDESTGRTTRYEMQAGRWTRVVLAGDVALACTRGAEGTIDRLDGPSGATVTFERDALGRRSRILYGAVATAAITYADSGQVREIVWARADRTPIYRLAYEYDASGRIVRADRGGRISEYGYDEHARLASTMSPDGNETYAYDLDGNLVGTGKTSWACDLDDRLRGPDVRHDGEGRLVAGPAATGPVECKYDGEGRLATVRAEGLEIVYGYGPGGELVSRRAGDTLDEFESLEGNQVARWRDGRLVAVYLTGESPDERYAVVADGRVQYTIADPSGTVLGLIDERGALAATQGYSGYGVPLAAGEPVGAFGFQGHWRDPVTGWLFLRTRWYDPERGRFLQPDAAEPDFMEPESLNAYAFAYADPVNHIDPWGYGPWIQPAVFTSGPGVSEQQAVHEAFKQFMGVKPPPSGSSLSTMPPKGFSPGNYFAFGKDGIAYDVWTRVNGNGQVEVGFRPFDYAEGGGYRDPTKGFNQIEAGKMSAPPSALSQAGLRVVQYGGKALLVYGAYRSLRNIWDACDWKNQAGREAAGWGAGWALGAKGSAVGLLYGGPWGAVIGGLAGGAGGYFLGRGAFDALTGTREEAHYISVALDQSDWYCTNRPEIAAGVNLPDILAVERTRRLEALGAARDTEAQIRAAADVEAQKVQAEFGRVLAALQAELDELNRPLPAGDYSQGKLMRIDEERKRRAAEIGARAEEAKALMQRSLKNLAVKTGRDVDAVRAKLAGELRPLPPPVIPPGNGPFGRPYGEPPIGIQK